MLDRARADPGERLPESEGRVVLSGGRKVGCDGRASEELERGV